MSEYPVNRAKNEFTRLLNSVEEGEDVVITRRGKPVARLVPFEAASPNTAPIDVETLRRLRAGVGTGRTPTIDTVRAMRDGYRY